MHGQAQNDLALGVEISRRDESEAGVEAGRATLAEVPALRFLSIEGHGDPNTSASYTAAVQALYSVSYAAKSQWDWMMMIRQPDVVTADLCERLVEEVAVKKEIPAARQLRLMTFEEGAAAQVLHVGPYAAEGPTIARLHEFIRHQGLRFDGPGRKHHEIYLGDPRRSAPEKLRTIIRQPCAT